MKKLNFLLIVLIFSLLSCTKDPLLMLIPKHKKTVLKNGLHVYFFEDHKLPTINFYFVTKTGTIHEPHNLKGLVSMTTSLLLEGTHNKSSTELAEALEFLGASFSASSGYDFSSMNASALSKDTDKILELMSEIILTPTFPDKEITRLKEETLASLKQIPDDAGGFASALFNLYVYNKHPYGTLLSGTSETLKEIQRKDIVEFYKNNFTPKNSILAVAGDFKTNELAQKLNHYFEKWENKKITLPTINAAEDIKKNKIYVVEKSLLTQSQIRIGNIALPSGHPDFFSYLVTNHILGGAFTSILNQKIRNDLGLTYSIHSSHTPSLHKGVWRISTFTRNETLNKTLQEIKNILDNFNTLVTQEELEKAKADLLGAFVITFENVDDFATQLMKLDIFNIKHDHLKYWRRKVQNITLEDVRKISKKYWNTDKLIITILTDSPLKEEIIPFKGDLIQTHFQNIHF
ncbi:MAG: insulinase family protein [Deltaproteobacteria bacterium]|nr:insulinase family protein [Deltaproteobacteria bacterium]